MVSQLIFPQSQFPSLGDGIDYLPMVQYVHIPEGPQLSSNGLLHLGHYCHQLFQFNQDLSPYWLENHGGVDDLVCKSAKLNGTLSALVSDEIMLSDLDKS